MFNGNGQLVTAPGQTQSFTLSDSAPGGGTTSRTLSLGPVSLQGPTISIADVGFKDGLLDLTIGFGADHAGLNFGSNAASGASSTSSAQSSSGVAINLTGIAGTFDIEFDALGLLSGHFRVNVPGKFSLNVAQLTATVPGVVVLTASGIQIGYDPQGPANQTLVSINSASISFPAFNLTGTIRPFDPNAGHSVSATSTAPGLIPGLVIRENGFTLGQAELDYGVATPSGDPLSNSASSGNAVSLGNILTFKDIRVGVQNFSVNFSAENPVVFNGSIYFASGGATFLPGKPVSATISALPGARNTDGTPNTEALRLTLSFANGQVSAFSFRIAQMSITLGSYLTLTATNFNLNTGAGPNDALVSFSSVGAQVKIGSLQINGQASNFQFNGDGSFHAGTNFGVYLSVGSATGDSFQWPSFLPVKIDAIGIQWPNINTDPGHFILTLSASITGIQGIGGLQVSGSVQGIQIDPSLLLQGQFPIIGISAFGVTVKGNLFGGELDGGLIGGILKLDSGYNIIDPSDTTTTVAHRVFYLGLQGGFSIGGMAGFTIRVGLSQLGPLEAFINVEIPGGILLDPDTGLTINNFSAGVEFFKTLPSITDPFALRNPEFGLPTQLTADQWLGQLQQQVAAQARATNGTANFFAAFTAPMTIIGSAEIYSIYTSQALFNGQVTVMISTDGKFMIEGKLNFANNNISISGKLYADLSQVSSGRVVILFLADIPDQVQLLTLYGKLQMGFENSSGQPVTFNVAAPPTSPASATTAPSAQLTDPGANGGTVDVSVANTQTANAQGFETDSTTDQHYLDITYRAATGANLDYTSILASASKITIGGTGFTGTASISAPIPVETITTAQGPLTVPLVLDTANHVVWRYGPGTETVLTFNPGDTHYGDAAGMLMAAGAASGFTHFDLQLTSQTVNGKVVYTVTDLAKVTVLAASSFSAGITDALLLNDAIDMTGTRTFRYLLGSGTGFTPGVVTVTLAQGAVKNADVTDSSGNTTTGAQNDLLPEQFTVEGPTAVILNPGQGGTIDINVLNNRHWIDVVFTEPNTATYRIDINSIINNGGGIFVLGGSGLGTLALDLGQAPTLLTPASTLATATSLSFRFWLTGSPAATGAVTLSFVSGSWSYFVPNAPVIPGVTVAAPNTTGQPTTTQVLASVNPVVNVTVTAPTGFTVNPASINLANVTISVTGTGWHVTIDASRLASLVSASQDGTSAVISIPIAITMDAVAASTASLTLTFAQNADSFFGSPAGATRYSDVVTHPVSDFQTTASGGTALENESYLDLRITPAGGGSLSGPPATDLFTLAGAGAAGVGFASGSNPIYLGNNVWRFMLAGSFSPGQVTLTFAGNKLTSTSARGPPTVQDQANTETFTVNGATADVTQTVLDPTTHQPKVISLSGSAIGAGTINAQGYIEITFSPTSGNVIDPATINGNEIQISGPGNTTVTLTGTPTREGTTNVWRYAFSGQLALGTYTVTFLAGSFADTGGIVNQAATETFTVSSPTSTLNSPGPGSIVNQAQISGLFWVDVTYPAINSQPVDPTSLGTGNQFTIADSMTDTLTQVGTPVQVGGAGSSTFRYFFAGFTGDNTTTFTLTFTAGTWKSLAGTASASGDAPATSGYTVTTGGTWVDVTLTPTLGNTVNASTVTGSTMTLSGPGLGTVTPVTGSGKYAVLQITANVFRFFYTGAFVPGQVTATFAAGGWADSAGNLRPGVQRLVHGDRTGQELLHRALGRDHAQRGRLHLRAAAAALGRRQAGDRPGQQDLQADLQRPAEHLQARHGGRDGRVLRARPLQPSWPAARSSGAWPRWRPTSRLCSPTGSSCTARARCRSTSPSRSTPRR